MTSQSTASASVEAEIKRIRSLGLEAARAEWRATFGRAPPPGLPKDLLARMMAYHMQEQVFGGLDRATLKLLDGLGRDGKPGRDHPAPRLKAGTVLVREYAGETHTVTAVPNGFVWREETYPNLSIIAKVITGTAWSGPRFFGLRTVRGKREPQASPQYPEPGRCNESDPGEPDRPVPRRRSVIPAAGA